MNRIIAIIGPSGVGKTSLLQALAATGRFEAGLEQHTSRPFQALFEHDKRFGLANQCDYLLYRAEQEQRLRSGSHPALIDGGLDMDFHGFTRLFHAKGWLSGAEFDLCERFYRFARGFLPLPDLILSLRASPAVIRSRLAARERINLASAQDSTMLQSFLDEWLASLPDDRVLQLDVSDEPRDYSRSLASILKAVFPNP